MTADNGLRMATRQAGDALVVRPLGRLDTQTYLQAQDALLRCVTSKPSTLVVELDELRVTNPSSLSVFTTVWIRAGEWPGVPVVLVTGRERIRAQLTRRKLSAFLPCFPSTSQALALVDGRLPHHRERVWLPPSLNALRWAKLVVDRFFLHRQTQAQPGIVQFVVAELLREAVRTAKSDISLRLDQYSEMLTVAVRSDDLAAPACPVRAGAAIADVVSASGRTPIGTTNMVTWVTFASCTASNFQPSQRHPARARSPEADEPVAAQLS